MHWCFVPKFRRNPHESSRSRGSCNKKGQPRMVDLILLWNGCRHPTSVESTQSKLCKPDGNSCGLKRKTYLKPGLRTFKRFSCWIGCGGRGIVKTITCDNPWSY